eukprot:Phypoly_transcript_14037.p1 GENE.Phypoly_transcript_14037~~Phypoly_transcript_14037.p1  ORF type:complete len:222 (+),score=31.26 Phypoly_transcript_14037:318-983(+)
MFACAFCAINFELAQEPQQHHAHAQHETPIAIMQRLNLEELEVHVSHLKEVMHCILHTIMFARAFGLVTPEDVYIDFMDFYYVKANNDVINKRIDEKTEEFCSSFAKRKAKKGQMTLSFFEKQASSTFFGGGKFENVCWEQWTINISLTSSVPKTANLANDLRDRVMYILRVVHLNKSHIPPITTKDVTPFSYEITMGGSSEGGVVGMVWNILKAPTPLLS